MACTVPVTHGSVALWRAVCGAGWCRPRGPRSRAQPETQASSLLVHDVVLPSCRAASWECWTRTDRRARPSHSVRDTKHPAADAEERVDGAWVHAYVIIYMYTSSYLGMYVGSEARPYIYIHIDIGGK